MGMAATPGLQEVMYQRVMDMGADDPMNFNFIRGVGEAPDCEFSEAVRHTLSCPQLAAEDLTPFVRCAQMFADNFNILTCDLNRHQIAAIHFYTQESPFYSHLNRFLRDRDRTKLKPFFPFLKLLLSAIYLLPTIRGTVYRGIKRNLAGDYWKSRTLVWWGFSSTTVELEVLQNPQFLGTSGDRTLFVIEANTAVDISRYSAINSERERLLIPGTQLRVAGVLPQTPELTIIQMVEGEEDQLLDYRRPHPPPSLSQLDVDVFLEKQLTYFLERERDQERVRRERDEREREERERREREVREREERERGEREAMELALQEDMGRLILDSGQRDADDVLIQQHLEEVFQREREERERLRAEKEEEERESRRRKQEARAAALASHPECEGIIEVLVKDGFELDNIWDALALAQYTDEFRARLLLKLNDMGFLFREANDALDDAGGNLDDAVRALVG